MTETKLKIHACRKRETGKTKKERVGEREEKKERNERKSSVIKIFSHSK